MATTVYEREIGGGGTQRKVDYLTAAFMTLLLKATFLSRKKKIPLNIMIKNSKLITIAGWSWNIYGLGGFLRSSKSKGRLPLVTTGGPDQSICKENSTINQNCPVRVHSSDGFLAKTLERSLFHFQNDRSGWPVLTATSLKVGHKAVQFLSAI